MFEWCSLSMAGGVTLAINPGAINLSQPGADNALQGIVNPNIAVGYTAGAG